MQPDRQPAPSRSEVFQQGAARLIKQAPSVAGALAAGGWLGLLAVFSIQSLLHPGPVAISDIAKVLESLGLNVAAGYLAEALKSVWLRTGKPPAATASPGEIAQALQRLTRERADVAARIAGVARDSGALQQTMEAIRSGAEGSAALLAGLVCDSRGHGAALEGLRTDLRQGLGAVYQLALSIQGDTTTIRAQTAELLRLAREDRAGLAALARQLMAQSEQRRQQDEVALRDYLSTLGEDCNRLSLADADTSDPHKSAVGMDSVYIRLEIARTVEPHDQEQALAREPRRLTAIQALAQQPRLVLLGAPGSGKSTFVNFLARCLSLARLGDRQRWLERLGAEWTPGALVPVYILLRDFTAWLAAQQPRIEHGDARLPWRFLAERHGPALVDLLHGMAHAGRALLLLDGLDEVGAGADGWPLVPVRESIVALASGLGAGSRILATCRVLDYQQPQRQLLGWPSDIIEPLSQELREQFIHGWYAELERLHRPLDAPAAILEQRLVQALRERHELRRLAGNPLLLTMMVLVHAYKRLPENRVKLYEECIEFLLHRWRRRADEQPLYEQLSLDQGQWTEKNLMELLCLLGHTAHQHGVDPDGESGADLPYQQVFVVAQHYFSARFGPHKSATRAEEFAEFIGQASNGILQVYSYVHSRDLVYRFPHRTFQEYLAGHALINGDLLLGAETPDDERDLVTRALHYVDTGAQWREALLLAAGRLVLNGSSRQVAELARELLPHEPAASALQARRVMLAGELLAEAGAKLVASMGRRLAPVWDETRDQLLPLLPHPPSVAAPPLLALVERVRAALILARLGDPRPGVRTLEPDWCGPFPARKYPIAEGQATARLAEFRIARYPVTVWQFRRFWADPAGYENPDWWPKRGWGWKQQNPVTTQPSLWDAPDWTAENQPVVGISWYEAVAFCNWLTARGGQAGWLRPGEIIRLPSEAEWEVAAMWDERAGRMRAWQPPEGEIWQNVAEAGIGRTAPVGLFPQGASPCGALDMAGNIWEWCASAYDDYPKQAHRIRDDFQANEYGPALRGGAYYLQNARSSWGARGGNGPNNLSDDRGCRVCACSAPRF